MTFPLPLRPLLLGVVTGLRSQLGLAALAWSQPAGPGEPAALRRLRSPAGRVSIGLSAAAELVSDKLPQTPGRLESGPFGGRLATGALVGLLAAGTSGRRGKAVAALAGVAGAAAGTYAGSSARRALPARTRTPDLPWALAEDAVAVTLATVAVRSGSRPLPWWRRR